MAREIKYSENGKFNGLTHHSWTCQTCQHHVVKLGGASAKRAGKKESDSHKCYDSSQDPQMSRKDIYG
jgi:hypothetical protein